MNRKNLSVLFAGMFLVLAQSSFAELCPNAFNTPLASEAKWRESFTQPDSKGQASATSANREALMKKRRDAMEDFILNYKGHFGTGDIPPVVFFPEEGASTQTLVETDGDDGIITRFKVSHVGKSGVIKGTLLLPVSGHNGNAAARKWAVTDTYDIRSEMRPSGNASTLIDWREGQDPQSDLVPNARSLGMVTMQEIEIPLNPNKGGSSLILYYRHGSGGPGGYIEGRIIEFFWDGT